MSTREQVVVSLRTRKTELLKELDAIETALATFESLGNEDSRMRPRSHKATKGFLSDETRRKISEKAKLTWAARKAAKAKTASGG
jgi:hypothetical protein